MQRSDDESLSPADLFELLQTRLRWWVIPTVTCAFLAAVYALFAPRYWKATQAFTVRPQAASVSEQQLGKFADLSEMKVRQATILELAKSPSVVRETLLTVGPPSRWSFSRNWPTPTDVEEFREQVDMRPPGGAEFGQTEVFYLSMLDPSQQRAADLVAALSDQLEQRMQRLRDDRAQSMMAELERTVAMADADLQGSTAKLSAFEAAIGADLVELRNLNSDTGAQSEVSQELQAIETERRTNAGRESENVQLLALLRAAQNDSRQLVATPNSLLRSQPAISRLKDALVDAQVKTASLLGTLAEDHPFAIAARETEERIQSQLHEELGVAIQGLEMDLNLNAGRDTALHAKSHAAQQRLGRLAAARAEYANLLSAVDNHTKLVEAARKNLADARADHASAHSASVIARIDGVQSGVRPVGPGRTTITAAGGVAGLIFGLGLVFVLGKPQPADHQAAAFAPPAPKAVTPQQTTESPAVAPESDDQQFGLFRGMTLEEAIRSVERRSQAEHVQ